MRTLYVSKSHDTGRDEQVMSDVHKVDTENGNDDDINSSPAESVATGKESSMRCQTTNEGYYNCVKIPLQDA